MSPLYVYMTPPIDWWGSWLTEQKFLVRLKEEGSFVNEDHYAIQKARAIVLALQLGWEGDVRDGPYVAGIPEPGGDTDYIIAWKQDNNGTTFIASPRALPWLNTDDCIKGD